MLIYPIIKLNMKLFDIKFDCEYVKKLYLAKKFDLAETYVKKFFFRYGAKIFYFDGFTFVLYEREKAVNLIPDDIKVSTMKADENLNKYIKEEHVLKSFLKTTGFMKNEYIPTIDFSKEIMFTKEIKLKGLTFQQKYLNMAKPMNIYLTERIDITPELQSHLDLIYTHIKEVLCSSDTAMYEYVLNFFACSLCGKKIRKALYFQSKERTGKGIIINGLLKVILGERMFKTSSLESIEKYTKGFEGRSLINFDELPVADNIRKTGDALKGLITEPTFICRDMFSTGYEQINTFNNIITSNNDAVLLTQQNNERYTVPKVSEHMVGNRQHFKALSTAMETENVVEAFYQNMQDRFKVIEETNWDGEEVPFSAVKKEKMIEALPQFIKYIKEEYILSARNINEKTDVFISNYLLSSRDKISKQKIGRMLSDMAIKPIKQTNNMGYKYIKSHKNLYEIYSNKGWIDEVNDVVNEFQNNNFDEDLDHGIKVNKEKFLDEEEMEKEEKPEEKEKEKKKEKKTKQRKTKEGKEIISSKGYKNMNILFD